MKRALACTLTALWGVASAQGDDPSRALIQWLLNPMPEVTGRDTQVLIGQVPPQFPLAPPPTMKKVLGSVINTERSGSMNLLVEVHLDASVRAEELRQYVKTQLSDWKEHS